MKPERKDLSRIYTGFELNKLAQGFARTHSLLKRLLSGVGTSTAQFVEPVKTFYRLRPEGVQAQLSPGDLTFVEAFVSTVSPRRIVEVGVASGFTSAYLLMSGVRNGKGQFESLISFDPAETVFWNDVLPTGFVVPELVPELTSNWQFQRGKTLLDVLDDPPFESPVLAIVDGEHRHPWPLVDVLVLLDKMPTGSWILLQDIRLPERLMGDAMRLDCDPAAGFYGPSLVYDLWTGPKVRGLDAAFNMGAVQIPEERAQLRRSLLETLVYPPEIEIGPDARSFLADL